MTTNVNGVPLFELKKIATDFPKSKIVTSADGYNFIRNFYLDDISIFESFFILLLNRANQTIGFAKISQGGIVGTVVDVRLVAHYAVQALATGVILAHNHPSGQLKPSDADIILTKKVIAGLEVLDIAVLDHLILTEENYYSFADMGQL